MGRTRTLEPQKKSESGTCERKLKTTVGLTPHDPMKTLLDENFIAKGVWECLKDNDYEGVLEVIQIHLRAVNKTKAAKGNNLARSSMYNAFKGKNPTLKTLAKLVHCCHMSK
jgi:DNA-binding phage protein